MSWLKNIMGLSLLSLLAYGPLALAKKEVKIRSIKIDQKTNYNDVRFKPNISVIFNNHLRKSVKVSTSRPYQQNNVLLYSAKNPNQPIAIKGTIGVKQVVNNQTNKTMKVTVFQIKPVNPLAPNTQYYLRVQSTKNFPLVARDNKNVRMNRSGYEIAFLTKKGQKQNGSDPTPDGNSSPNVDSKLVDLTWTIASDGGLTPDAVLVHWGNSKNNFDYHGKNKGQPVKIPLDDDTFVNSTGDGWQYSTEEAKKRNYHFDDRYLAFDQEKKACFYLQAVLGGKVSDASDTVCTDI